MAEDDQGTEDQGTPEDATLLGGDKDAGTEDGVIKDAVDAKDQDAGDSDGDAKDGDDDSSDDDQKSKDADGAPDEYADFTMPDGVEADKELVAEASVVFKEQNFTQDQAQAIVDFDNARQAKAAEAQQTTWADTLSGWVDEVKADKDIGGDKFDETVSVAKKAIDAFGTPALASALDATGVGSHPEFVRFFHAVGVAIADDTIKHGGDGGESRPRTAQDLYTNSNMNP